MSERWTHNATFAGPESLDDAIDGLEGAGYEFQCASSTRGDYDPLIVGLARLRAENERLRAAIEHHHYRTWLRQETSPVDHDLYAALTDDGEDEG